MKFNKKNGVIVKPNDLKTKKEDLKFNVKSLFKKRIGRFSIKQIGLLVICFVMLFLVIKGIIGLFDPARKIPNYSIVYRDNNGNLRVSTKNGKEITKLAGDTSSVVRYANKTERYILYTKEDNLYLYDKNKGDKTKRIDGDVLEIFGFSADDKYIYYINSDNELYAYKNKSIKIDDSVMYVYGVSKDYIIYQKENAIYYTKLNGKSEPSKIVENAKNKIFNAEGTKMYYINDDNNLYYYEVGKKKSVKVSNDVDRILDVNEEYNQLIYVNNTNNIYYAKNNKTKKLVGDVDSLYYVDAKELKLVYSYDNELYYQQGNNNEIKVENVDNVKNITSAYLFNNELYYVENIDDNYNLYYAKIGAKKTSDAKIVLKDVDDGIITGYKKGLIVFTSRNGTIADLNIVKSGKNKKIADNVLVSSLIYSHNKKVLYFIADYENKNSEGKLMKLASSKAKVLLEKVNNFNYIKDDIIYLQMNYSKNNSTTDLKVLYKAKLIDIADSIKDMISVPIIIK